MNCISFIKPSFIVALWILIFAKRPLLVFEYLRLFVLEQLSKLLCRYAVTCERLETKNVSFSVREIFGNSRQTLQKI